MDQKRDSIVFINQSSGYLMVDIIYAFKDKYKNITLITGDLNIRNKELPASVKVFKILSPKRNSSAQRILTWTWGFIQIYWKLLLTSRKTDLFIVSNPPMATLLPLFFRNKYKLLLFDIYPDALIEHKILSKKSFVIRLWAKLNRKVFSQAEEIFTLTEGMKLRASKYVNNSKVTVIPIWTDNAFFKQIKESENIFIREQQLENKFIVMYSGNLGHTHNIEALVDLAFALRDEEIEVPEE